MLSLFTLRPRFCSVLSISNIHGRSRSSPEFSGYHHSLDAICLRMRTDRETLNQRTSYGRTAKFHLLIPAYSPLVIDHPIVFHDSLLPLTFIGQRHRQADFVWLKLCHRPQGLDLKFVGLLRSEENPVERAGTLGFAACWTIGMACGVAGIVFPPCIPAIGPIVASSATGGVASLWTALAAGIYDDSNREETRVLGDPLFFAE
ncbi:hypothetical protein V8F44DRAFT_489761 [Aspergillus fumigatus]